MKEVYEGDKPYLFISYSHKDEKVLAYIDALRRNMCRIWYDVGNHAGDDWADVIGNHLLTAKKVLFFISENSLNSKYVNAEITMALSHNIDIIPVRIEEVQFSPGMEIKIGHLHFIDVFKDEMNEACKTILSELPKDIFDIQGEPFYVNDVYDFHIKVETLQEYQTGDQRKMLVIATNRNTNETKELYSFITPPPFDPNYKILDVSKSESDYFDEQGNETVMVHILVSLLIEYPLYGDDIDALFSLAIVKPLTPDIHIVPLSYKLISPITGKYDAKKSDDQIKEEAKQWGKRAVQFIIDNFEKGEGKF